MDNKKWNIGISLGRLVLCFLVVMCHFDVNGGIAGYIKKLAVPAFTFIAFYLTHEIFYDRDSDKIRKRLERLLYPYIFWAIFYYVGVSCVKKEILPIKELILQLICGSNNNLNPTLWFLLAQILYVLVISVVAFLAKDSRQMLIVLVLLAGICLLLHYTGVSVELFWEWRTELKWLTGFTLEVFPYAVLGIFFGRFEYCGEGKVNKKVGSFVCAIVFSIGISLPEEVVVGFGYYGIKMLICGVSLAIFFVLLPLEMNKGAIVINSIAKCSLGIYCIHLGIGRFLLKILPQTYQEGMSTIWFCVIIYICSIIVSFLIEKLPCKLTKKMVS